MPNEIEIVVSGRNELKGTLRDVKQDVQRASKEVEREGRRAGSGFSDGLEQAGVRGAAGLAGGLSSSLGPTVLPIILAIGAPVALALAAVLAAALPAAIATALGGGILIAGVVAAVQDPRLAGALAGLKSAFSSALSGFVEPFIGPLQRAIAMITANLPAMANQFKLMGVAVAPIIDMLMPALIAMANQLLPEITTIVQHSIPFFAAMIGMLPHLTDLLIGFLHGMQSGITYSLAFGNAVLQVSRWLGGVVRPVIDYFVRNALPFLRAQFAQLQGTMRNNSGELQTLGKWLRAAADIAIKVLAFAVGTQVVGALHITMATISATVQVLGAFVRGAQSTASYVVSSFRSIENAAHSVLDVLRSVSGAASSVGSFLGLQHGGIASGFAHGGIPGAASGGGRSGMTWVGERGPELVHLPGGSRVRTHEDSQQMAGSSGAGGGQLKLVGDDSIIIQALLQLLRKGIRLEGGDVQLVLGS